MCDSIFSVSDIFNVLFGIQVLFNPSCAGARFVLGTDLAVRDHSLIFPHIDLATQDISLWNLSLIWFYQPTFQCIWGHFCMNMFYMLKHNLFIVHNIFRKTSTM